MVDDQEAALKWYTEVLGLEVRSDTPMREGRRWVTVGPKNQPALEIVLQHTSWGPGDGGDDARQAMVGKTPGFIFETDDIAAEMATLQARVVQFHTDIMDLPWGKEAVFADLYGNAHVLSQPPTAT